MSVSYYLEKLRAVVHVSKWFMTVWQGASTRVNSLKYNSAITVFIYSCAFLLSGQDAFFEKDLSSCC